MSQSVIICHYLSLSILFGHNLPPSTSSKSSSSSSCYNSSSSSRSTSLSSCSSSLAPPVSHHVHVVQALLQLLPTNNLRHHLHPLYQYRIPHLLLVPLVPVHLLGQYVLHLHQCPHVPLPQLHHHLLHTQHHHPQHLHQNQHIFYKLFIIFLKYKLLCQFILFFYMLISLIIK